MIDPLMCEDDDFSDPKMNNDSNDNHFLGLFLGGEGIVKWQEDDMENDDHDDHYLNDW